MKKTDGFYFIPKKWLGDANIISMDWDCKGMHLHLMSIAWQQELKGHLINDEALIKKLLGNPTQEDWEKRIKPQIFKAWKIKTIKENGKSTEYLYQPGILKTVNNETETPVKRQRKTKTLIEVDNANVEGFNLSSLLKAKPTTTILHEKADKSEKTTIWNIGVQLLGEFGDSETKARAFLARTIKQYGEKPVAAVIAELSLKKINPAEIHAYIIGSLKAKQEPQQKTTGRGSVSL